MEPSTSLFRQAKQKAKYLLIVNKGPGAVQLKREGDKWDLLEIYFMKADIEAIKQDPAKIDAEYIVFETDRQMRKFAIIKRIFEAYDFWKGYAAIMMADDDLVPVGCTITDIFEFFIKTGLRIGQPALAANSFWSHEITLRNSSFHWRKTNFVEVMCPIMTPEAVTDYLPMFDATISAFGLDYYWGLNEWKKLGGLAILDDTPMRHCRPVGGGIAYQGLSPGEECRKFVQQHRLKRYMHLILGGDPTHSQMPFRIHSYAYVQRVIEGLRRMASDWSWQCAYCASLVLFFLRGMRS